MKVIFNVVSRAHVALLLGAALASVNGCGDDKSSSETENVQTPASDGGSSSPLYLIHTAVESSGNRTNYFSLVDSLQAANKLDYANSLELFGRARLYASRGNAFFAIGEGESPKITRYEFNADKRFVAGGSISLETFGVKAMGPQAVLFVSPTKAYYKDQDQNQIIVWNPTAMTVDKAIPLPAVAGADGNLLLFSQWAARDGEAYFTAGTYTTTYDRVFPGTHLIRVNTETDEVTTIDDSRCRGLNKTASVGGTLYFFSDVFNAFGNAVHPNDYGQTDCFLRISQGSKAFDSDFVGSVAAAFPGKQAATVVAVTQDGRAWAQVADTSITPTAPGTTAAEWYSKGWSWAHVTLANPVASERVAGDMGAYSGNAFAMGSDFFVSQPKGDYSESTLVNAAGPTAVPGLSFGGFALDVTQVQ